MHRANHAELGPVFASAEPCWACREAPFWADAARTAADQLCPLLRGLSLSHGGWIAFSLFADEADGTPQIAVTRRYTQECFTCTCDRMAYTFGGLLIGSNPGFVIQPSQG